MSSLYLYCIFLYNILHITTFTSADQIKLKVHPTADETTSGLIWFNSSTNNKWSQQLDNYLEVYRTPALTEGRKENLVYCSYEKPISEETVCYIKADISPCTASNHFGYKFLSPCVFIEFDKILDWKPKFYNSTKSLPKKMPTELKEFISGTVDNTNKRETIWLWCEGETPADKEFIGPVSYYPRVGYPGYMFPYTGQAGYLSPVVALHFERPKPGVIVNVICKLWGPNIIHDYQNQIGLVRFSFLIDM